MPRVETRGWTREVRLPGLRGIDRCGGGDLPMAVETRLDAARLTRRAVRADTGVRAAARGASFQVGL